jgi:glycosyltransferase involved in cell wall biosynthesis
VVDDGSGGKTREVICSIDDRLKYIYQANAGVSAARNTGLGAATEKYIAFLDSDDSWLPRKVEAYAYSDHNRHGRG